MLYVSNVYEMNKTYYTDNQKYNYVQSIVLNEMAE